MVEKLWCSVQSWACPCQQRHIVSGFGNMLTWIGSSQFLVSDSDSGQKPWPQRRRVPFWRVSWCFRSVKDWALKPYYGAGSWKNTMNISGLDGVAISSDAFFPFRDSIDHATRRVLTRQLHRSMLKLILLNQLQSASISINLPEPMYPAWTDCWGWAWSTLRNQEVPLQMQRSSKHATPTAWPGSQFVPLGLVDLVVVDLWYVVKLLMCQSCFGGWQAMAFTKLRLFHHWVWWMWCQTNLWFHLC